MILHKTPQLPKGFKADGIHCGLKAQKELDLGVVFSSTIANASAVFTKNLICGAPITVGREIIKGQKLQAIIVNSKISNVATGEQGIKNVHFTSKKLAEKLQISPKHILVSSTGIIGEPLPIEKILSGIEQIQLTDCPEKFSQAIMTTDKAPKMLSCTVDDCTLSIIAKGAGMISPNMATMLVYILTDADISTNELDKCLRHSVNKTFNCLSIDSDTSTSDTVVIMANGHRAKPNINNFQNALNEVCLKMTKRIASGGEGANRTIIVNIHQAKNTIEANDFAQFFIDSPLIKTMCHGGDPNVGRILMALGKRSQNSLNLDNLVVDINKKTVIKNAQKINFNEKVLRKNILQDEVVFDIYLGIGNSSASRYGCDLSKKYVEENASYYSS